MIRKFAVALALLFAPALAASAQTPQAADDDLTRAWGVLAADWRPFDIDAADASAAAASACEGALEEMQALDAAMPEDLSAAALSQIRAPHGLIIIPSDTDPHRAYIFPTADLSFMTSGPAAVAVTDAEDAVVSLTDASGRETQLQLGSVETLPVMRLQPPAAARPLYFVGCASTSE